MNINQQQWDRMHGYQPQLQFASSEVKAAVAIILLEHIHGVKCLMIQRALSKKDPWSGQMAFPGGKVHPADDGILNTAIRETAEETNITLTDVDYWAQMDDICSGKATIKQFHVHLSCYVFRPRQVMNTRGNHEVADLVWVPLSLFNDRLAFCNMPHPLDSAKKVPAIVLNRQRQQYIWGLSLRVMVNLFAMIRTPMNSLTKQESEAFRKLHRFDIPLSSSSYSS